MRDPGWLCGDDPFTGTNFDHRKEWVVDRAKELAGAFAVKIHAYAVMSNHYLCAAPHKQCYVEPRIM